MPFNEPGKRTPKAGSLASYMKRYLELGYSLKEAQERAKKANPRWTASLVKEEYDYRKSTYTAGKRIDTSKPESLLDRKSIPSKYESTSAYRIGFSIKFNDPVTHKQRTMGFYHDVPFGFSVDEAKEYLREKLKDYMLEKYSAFGDDFAKAGRAIRDLHIDSIEKI